MIALPEPDTRGKITVEEAIVKRRSVRAYEKEPLSDKQISQLLWSAQGITSDKRGYRATPSAGATCPLETYIVTEKGVFHYLPDKHALEEIKKGDFRGQLATAALGQKFIREAPVNIVFTAVFERTTGRYGDRGIRYVHMEAGHAAENIHLQAVALGLASVPVGAFSDRDVEAVLGSPEGEKVLYIIPVGKGKVK